MSRLDPIRRPLAFLLATMLLVACGESPATTPPPPPEVAFIRVIPAAPTVTAGESVQLEAIPHASPWEELPDRPVTWSSDQVAVATVSAQGLVTAHRPGVVTITARSEAVERRVTVQVVDVPAASIHLDRGEVGLVEGDLTTLQASVRDAMGRPLADRVVTWVSDDPAIATVSATGVVRASGEGTVQVRARHQTVEAALTVRVTPTFGGVLLFASVRGNPYGTLPSILRFDPRLGDAAPAWLSSGTWQPAVSADGSKLAFTCQDDGPAICASNIDGTGLRVLTAGDRAYEDEPSWSPDGSRIAFRRWPQGATPGPFNPTDIWVMAADGTQQQNLTNDALSQHRPTWSPLTINGAMRIAFSEERLEGGYITSRIATMLGDGSDRRAVTSAGAHTDLTPSWFPDGRAILFTRAGGTVDEDLWRVDLATGAERPFLSFALSGAQRHPTWSPDGRYVLFLSNHEPTSAGYWGEQFYTVRADGTRLVRRTDSALDKADPAWVRRP